MQTRRVVATVVAIAAALFAAGCGGDEGPSPASAGGASEVTFRATDGVRLSATLRPASARHAPALVLAHQSGSDRHDFDGVVAALHDAGYTTLAYDGREQGTEPSAEWFAKLPRDVAGAVAFLRSRPEADRARIGLMGASLGASLGVRAIGTSSARTLRAAVVLSPRDAPDVRPPGTRPHDVLYVADELEIGASRSLARITRGARTLEIRGGGHGVSLLPEARVRRALLAWFGARLS
jgi:alpha-beta hydrolase superfamily lysophospholipase